MRCAATLQQRLNFLDAIGLAPLLARHSHRALHWGFLLALQSSDSEEHSLGAACGCASQPLMLRRRLARSLATRGVHTLKETNDGELWPSRPPELRVRLMRAQLPGCGSSAVSRCLGFARRRACGPRRGRRFFSCPKPRWPFPTRHSRFVFVSRLDCACSVCGVARTDAFVSADV